MRHGKTLLPLVALLLAAGCGRKASIDDVVLISIDTFRADHVRPDTTPHILALAGEGIRFENVLSPVPLTLPAHSAMLTGTLPPRNGMHDNLGYRLSDENVTLAEVLKSKGFATGAIVSSFVLSSKFNLSQGFDSYNDQFVQEHKIAYLSERKGDETTSFAEKWLEAHRREKFFLFLHYYDPHDDYSPPEPFRSRFATDPYSGEVAFADEQVGKVVAELKTLGLYDSTLVVVTGDHGEMLEEHGERTHGFFIYQSALRVPLVIRPPGLSSPRVVSEWASLVDIVPTVASLLGITPPPRTQGRDLSPLWNDPAAPWARRELYAESVTPDRYYGARPLFGLLADRWKYIHTKRPELYDLSRDPEESTNVLSDNPQIAEGMKKRLGELLSEKPADATTELDEDSRRRLAALGYLSGGRSSSPSLELDTTGKDATDAKDWIGFYRKHEQLEKLVNDGSYPEARALATEMLKEHPDFAAGHLQLARIATEEKDLESARREYEAALELDDANQAAHYNLANILRELGQLEPAIAQYRRVLELAPDMKEARERLARVLIEAGRPAEAAGTIDAGTGSTGGEAHFQMANALAAQGKWQEAASEFEKALPGAPDPAEVQHRLGLALRQAGKPGEALVHLQQAAQVSPERADIHSDVGVVLKQLGRTDEAVAEYEKALAIDPNLSVANNDSRIGPGLQR